MVIEQFTKRFFSGLSAILYAVVMVTCVWAAEGDERVASIQPLSQQSDFFGAQQGALAYRCVSAEALQGKVLWQYAAGARTLARGEDTLQLAAGRPGVFELPIEFPPVREGVVLATRMVITIVDGNNEPLATYEQPIWLFPEDPYTDRREWLAGLDIHLYDPEDATAKCFEEAKIPYTRITNSNVLTDFEGGLLIVGSRTSLRKNRGLTDNLMKLAQRGVRVVCIAPVDGEFPWPTREEYPELVAVQFSSKQAIGDLDKRLNPDFDSLADPPQSVNRVTLESHRGQLRVHLAEASDGWPWWEVRFNNDGTCILCCFDLIQHWDSSPTPRFLLARLLEKLTSETDSSPTEQ
ncbi:hypothetical protein C5Y96_25570 [Blastopirellula marina]|uniref:Uncharacterized protein n=1 Tax=Blastopirellula marina TaxID=124 RepID=A0A2S8EZC1_9BACT|nr:MULTISPECIES: hypothetical protein [Pirellulaceae]PQO25276.1 hypothetical protein C5Y96_25570 [Blastopirellula marina]RCS41709.1 hypothetical protein DTL36_25620 [Bremerella cremea]